MKRLFIGALLALLAAGGCTENPCKKTCARLAACGMLPSPLGRDVGECAARCDATSDEEEEQIRACIDVGTEKPEWDGTPSSCNTIDRCLRDYLPAANLGGATNLRVVPVWSPAGAADGSVPSSSSSASDLCPAAASCGTCITDDQVSPLCEDVARVTAILKPSGAVRDQASDCLTAYSTPLVFENVAVGRVRALWVVEGAIPAQVTRSTDAGAPDGGIIDPRQPATCEVYASEPTLVAAGACQGLGIVIDPARAIACENTEAACADNADNDGDDRIDCADPKCQPHCLEETPTPPTTESAPGSAGSTMR